TSYHEAGHAVVTYFCETQDPVHEISIVPRGYAGGYTMSLPVEDRNYVTKRYMEEELCTLLGGRVAEAIVLGDISTGASNDLERATRIARNMVTRYGFSEKLGPIVYGSDENEVFLGRDYGQNKHYSDDIASDIDSEIRRLVDEAYERTESILNEHRDKLDAVAAVLMEKEKVTGKEFEDIMNPKPAVEEPETTAPVLEEAPAEEAPEQTEE
ncbi:MAG: ATP-dependent zinc metalloprotease FtsH, partial [Oscillospiraceae bacterium]|nr:ATP-dependent zinc metalloprotease FtsH [Oscillospiraceae bacterium]